MYKEGDEIHVSEEEASGGAQTNTMRYVLTISLLLVVIAMSAVWIIPALMG